MRALGAAAALAAAAAQSPAPAPRGPVRAQALFAMEGVQGSIVFEQRSGDASSSVTVDLTGLKDGPNPWHIHEHAVAAAAPGQHADCASTGDHFEKDASGLSRWDMGQLDPTGPDGAFRDGPTLNKGAAVALSGPHSIVGRSVVVHKKKVGATAARWVCANITYVQPDVAAWAVFDAEGVQGSIQFTQGTDGSQPTHVAVDLTGLRYGPNPWHVHEHAIAAGQPTDCATAGGHFGAASVWDLGSKFGKLTPSAGGAVSAEFTESGWDGLPLFGAGSIIGKSIVIHRSTDERWVCATITERPACRDDDAWDDGHGGCKSIASALQCLEGGNTQARMLHCARTCGHCPDTDSASAVRLDPHVGAKPASIQAGSSNWFHFSATAGTSYEIVATVIPGVSNLRDSVIELYKDADRTTSIEMNDDAGDTRGSKISWTCPTSADGVYWVKVRGFDEADHGYYTIQLSEVAVTSSCNDGVKSDGEEGVDCGGSDCAPCHISVILDLNSAKANTTIDEDQDGVPDFFQHLEHDVKAALNTTGQLFWSSVRVKGVQSTASGLNVCLQLQAPAGAYEFMEPELVVDSLRRQIHTPGSVLRRRQPELRGVSRGVLCATGGAAAAHLCGYGRCGTGANVAGCECEEHFVGACHQCEQGWEGAQCAERTVAPPPPESSWMLPTAGCVILALVVVGTCRYQRVQKRKYNQSVFEMLQAPDSFAGPSAGYVKTTPGGLLRTVSQGQSGATPTQLSFESKQYTPNQDYVTGGF